MTEDVMSLGECIGELNKIDSKLTFLVQALDSDNDEFCEGLHYILSEIKTSVKKLINDVDLNDMMLSKK